MRFAGSLILIVIVACGLLLAVTVTVRVDRFLGAEAARRRPRQRR
jgi:hypothetical protein